MALAEEPHMLPLPGAAAGGHGQVGRQGRPQFLHLAAQDTGGGQYGQGVGQLGDQVAGVQARHQFGAGIEVAPGQGGVHPPAGLGHESVGHAGHLRSQVMFRRSSGRTWTLSTKGTRVTALPPRP